MRLPAELVLGAAVQCGRRADYIQAIMSLEEARQAALMVIVERVMGDVARAARVGGAAASGSAPSSPRRRAPSDEAGDLRELRARLAAADRALAAARDAAAEDAAASERARGAVAARRDEARRRLLAADVLGDGLDVELPVGLGHRHGRIKRVRRDLALLEREDRPPQIPARRLGDARRELVGQL